MFIMNRNQQGENTANYLQVVISGMAKDDFVFLLFFVHLPDMIQWRLLLYNQKKHYKKRNRTTCDLEGSLVGILSYFKG